MFLFRQKKVVLDCFTDNSSAFEFTPPVNAGRVMPEWWKALPTGRNVYKFDEPYLNTNMRGCTGMIDLYRKSVSLPLWSDLDLMIGRRGTEEYKFQFADLQSNISSHPASQYGGLMDASEVQHLKLESPWFMRTKEDLDWVVTPATYSHKIGEYQLLPGVANFKMHHATHVQMVVPRGEQDTLLHIKYGTPLYLLTPLTSATIEIRKHIVTKAEKDAMTLSFLTRHRGGMLVTKLRRQAEDERQQCPLRNLLTKEK